MKRTLIVAVSAALFTTLLGGLAAADPTSDASNAETGTVVRVDDGNDVDVRGIWIRCRKLYGDDEMTVAAHEKCVQIWKRWCNAHPRARHCPRPQPPPPCRITDQVVDRRCEPIPLPPPCRIIDQVIDRWCPPPECLTADAVLDRLCLPPECLTTDTTAARICVPYPCLAEDGKIVKCVPIPTERPTDQPSNRPVVRPADRPEDKPADTPPRDRLIDELVDRPIDRAGNDVHLRSVNDDS